MITGNTAESKEETDCQYKKVLSFHNGRKSIRLKPLKSRLLNLLIEINQKQLESYFIDIGTKYFEFYAVLICCILRPQKGDKRFLHRFVL